MINKKLHDKNLKFLKEYILKNNLDFINYKENFKVKYFSSGGGTHLYLIINGKNKFLARINYYFKKNEWRVKRQEYNLLKKIEKLNISPKVFLLNEKNRLLQHFTIVEYINGSPIKKFTNNQVIKIAEELSKLHKFKVSYNKSDNIPYKCDIFETFANGEDKKIENYIKFQRIKTIVPIFNDIKSSLGIWFNSLPIFKDCKKFVLCHGDLKKENILSINYEVKLIDWEYTDIDVLETDIARLFSGCRFNAKQQNTFIRAYFSKYPSQLVLDRILAIKTVLDFFNIIEDYCIYKRKKWDSKNMLRDLIIYKKDFEITKSNIY